VCVRRQSVFGFCAVVMVIGRTSLPLKQLP